MMRLLFLMIIISFNVQSEVVKDDLTFFNIPEQLVNEVYDKKDVISTRPRTHAFSGWLGNSLVITTEFGSSKQLHQVNSPLGVRKQITFESDSTLWPRPSPDGRYILFLKNDDKKNNFQIYLWSKETNTVRKISNHGSRHGYMVWSHDSNTIYYNNMERNGKFMDIWSADISDLKNIQRKLLAKSDNNHLLPIAIDENNENLLFNAFFNSNKQFVKVLNINTGKTLFSTEEYGESFSVGLDLSRDGNKILYSSNLNKEFKHLYLRRLKKSKSKSLSEKIPWNVRSAQFKSRSRTIIANFDENGSNSIYSINEKRNKIKAIRKLPLGQIRNIKMNPKETKFAYTYAGSSVPSDVYVYNFKTRKSTRWTESESPGKNSINNVEPSLISYPTFDTVDGEKRMIPALFYMPKSKTKNKRPVLIYMHGGPEGQSKISYNSGFQKLMRVTGTAIIQPNYRGSTGYGKSYTRLDDGFKRTDALQDIEELIKWIELHPELDSSRIGVLGTSYSGYLALAIAAKNPKKIKVVVSRWGIAHFTSFLEKVPPARKSFRRAEYGDERLPEYIKYFDEISPLNMAQNISAKVLLAHGANDIKVDVNESNSLFEKLTSNGEKPWYIRAENEGHGAWSKPNKKILRDITIEFIKRNL